MELLRKTGDAPILIATHERPDGDAVASLSAAVSILRDNGYQATAILPDPVPDSYAAFVAPWVVSSAAGMACALFITIDASTGKRIAAGGYPFESVPDFVNIDHHPDNEKFGTLQVIDSGACSASQVFYDLCRACHLRISKENATRLLLGIITDSGCFRFDNTSPGALRAAADLMALGADHHSIIVSSYCSRDESLARLESEIVLHRMKRAFDGKLAWIVLDPELLERFGVEVRNTESLIDVPRNLKGVEFAALLREENARGGWKLSLRTKNAPYSAGRIARRLSGGGHEMAAGGFITASSLAEAEEILLKHVEMELNR